MKPGDKVTFVEVENLIGAWVRKGKRDFTIIERGTPNGNPRVRDDEDGAVSHVAPGGWGQYVLIALPPQCPDTVEEAVRMGDDVARRLETERRFAKIARELVA